MTVDLPAFLLLSNVFADALAHFEAGDERSLVLCDEGSQPGAWVGAFLDWQRAGDVVAAVLEEAGFTVDGRPLFTIPARLSPPPEVRAGAPVGVPGSSPAGAGPPKENLVGLVIGTARDVFAVAAERHNFLCREIHRARPSLGQAVLADLQKLDERELGLVLERLDGEKHRRALSQLAPGVHR